MGLFGLPFPGEVQRERSDRARKEDARQRAELTLNPSKWAENPGRFDYPGVDTPGRGTGENRGITDQFAAGEQPDIDADVDVEPDSQPLLGDDPY